MIQEDSGRFRIIQDYSGRFRKIQDDSGFILFPQLRRFTSSAKKIKNKNK
jgi:hypothetical protein